MDYYDLLAISKDSGRDEIEQAYKKAVAKYNMLARHPGHTLEELRVAYETLIDEHDKTKYDISLSSLNDDSPTIKMKVIKPMTKERKIMYVLILAVFVLLSFFYFFRIYGYKIKALRPGYTLIDIQSKRAVGVILKYDVNHKFPNGKSSPAFWIYDSDHNNYVWYSAEGCKETYREGAKISIEDYLPEK